jgi:hypothetical protein
MKLIHKKPHTGHEIHEGLSNVGHDPYIDWLLILVLGVLVTVALVAAGALSFMRVGETLSQVTTAATSTSSSVIDQGMLEHILGQYEARARERSDLIKGYKGPLDPSL